MIVEKPMFSLNDAGFGVADRVILHPLTLDVHLRGKVVGLIGHNGSGKSTLLKLLARQNAPTMGNIRLEDRGLGAWGSREIARKVAYLAQSLPSAAGMTVRELVSLGRYPWHGALGRFGKIDQERTEEAIELTGVAQLADRLVDTLSGGERQRAWLAMLVAQDADCLLLDEPIAALDVAHQVEVLNLVRALSRSRDLGVILVLHDVNMAARFCDEIIALHSGRVISRGSATEIMRSSELKRIYGIEMSVMSHPETGAPIAVPC